MSHLPYAPDAPPADKELLEAAVDMATAAGKLTLEYFSAGRLAVETKADGSPVTAADKAAEAHIRNAIAKISSDASIVGEEEGSSTGTSDLTWYIDPIDGTKGFIKGVPLYATLIAVNDAYGPAIGIIHIPATGESVWAGRGLGAWDENGPVAVSKVETTTSSYVTTSSVTRWGTDVYDRVIKAGMDVRGWGDGYGFLMAATGRVEAMIDLDGGSPWDFAPMPVIFAEAGGRYSALDGSSSIEQKSAIASNGLVHDAILDAVNG